MSSGVHTPKEEEDLERSFSPISSLGLAKAKSPRGMDLPGNGVWPGSGSWGHRNCSPGSETNQIILVKETIKTEGLKAKRENGQGPECPIP